MAIKFFCPDCGKKLKAPDDWTGRSVACPDCGTRLVVPDKRIGTAAPPRAAAAPDEAASPRRSTPFAVPSFQFAKFEDLVDMTAMVDIVFFLLIFFMVTAMQGLASSIAMPPPDQQKAAGQGRRSVSDFEKEGDYAIVRIDRDNSVWLEGSEIPSEQELRVRLRASRQAANKMLVLGSGDALHGTVVMVLDAGNDVGMEEVRLAVSDEEL